MQFYDFYELMCDNFQKKQFLLLLHFLGKLTAALAPMTRTRQARLDRNNCIECLTARLAASSHLAHIIFPTRNLFFTQKSRKEARRSKFVDPDTEPKRERKQRSRCGDVDAPRVRLIFFFWWRFSLFFARCDGVKKF